MERNYPTIYLYGNESADGDEQAAKVRIAFSRERDDRSRAEKLEGEWICKIVSMLHYTGYTCPLTTTIVYLRQFSWSYEMLSLSNTSDR